MKKYRYFIGDFETTVYEGQTTTEVWASGLVEMYTENGLIFHNITDTFDYLFKLRTNIILYYHNLKFDGNFILDYLLTKLKYEQALVQTENGLDWQKDKYMSSKTFKYSISDRGQWYFILIKRGHYFIEIRDSLKLLPFSVAKIGKDFHTKHKKLQMEYKGFRYAGCEIKESEKKYLLSDLYVVKEALEKMFDEGHDRLTIGTCCLSEYKNICNTSRKSQFTYNELHPDLTNKVIDGVNIYEYVRKSYRGGWCYLKKGCENKIYKGGLTADVNSLYPSVMHSMSGNRYPIGTGYYSKGAIPEIAKQKDKYYFVRIKTRFYLKPNYLPFIQIKNSFLYKGTEMLESSDVKIDGKYYTHYTDMNGNKCDTRVELVFTMTDYELFLEHYNVVDFEILDCVWFYSAIGIFDEYIDKYKQIKVASKGAVREIAKLFLNNLYGKLASSTDSSFKVAYIKDDGSIGFTSVSQHNKKAGYIPCGSAITSYARNFTIRTAQKNYRNFIYADTDSIHCNCTKDKLVGVPIHETEFCHWKLESFWDKAVFARQKTYIEHITHSDEKEITPYYNIKCAGMPDRCKNYVNALLLYNDGQKTQLQSYLETTDKNVLKFFIDSDGNIKKFGLSDFKVGMEVYGKLLPKRIKGGIILKETTYKMR